MAVQEQRPPKFYSVPPGAEGKPCRVKECGATIYLIPSVKTPGSWVPIDCGVVGGIVPTATEHGSGVNHYTTCTDPKRFHRPKAPAPPEPTRVEQRELSVDHKPRTCIVCGCTPAKACRLTVEEAGLMAELLPDSVDADGFIGCSWLQLDPPVCSAPKCAERLKELPLRMRVGKR